MSDVRPPGIDGRRCDDSPADVYAFGICPVDRSTLRVRRVMHRGNASLSLYCPACGTRDLRREGQTP